MNQCLIAVERFPSAHWIGDWLGPRADLEVEGNRSEKETRNTVLNGLRNGGKDKATKEIISL
jgi:hypothetical protein